MVVRIQLTIKHIRGHSFPIDATVDSDILGLKVQIWESQKIPLENQRLVYGGKELQDNLKLSAIGINDNAMIFLVESNSDIPQPSQSEVPQVTIQMPMPTQIVHSGVINQNQTIVSNEGCSHNVSINGNDNNYYQPLDNEVVLSEERIQSVVGLGHWIRLYCLFGMIICGLSIFGCLFSIVPFLIYTFGLIGARKLNRCLLIFPLLITIFIGFGLSSFSIFWLIYFFNGYLFVYLFIGLLHICIMFCISKLMCRIGHLSCEEWCQARIRIHARGCCC